MREKIEKLNEDYFRLFWRLENNKKGLSKAQYEKAQEVLFKQYEREYNLLNDTEGLELDKQLAELALLRDKQETEIEIQEKTSDQEQKEKKERLIPNDLPRRWWQFRARPNYAKQLAAEEVQLEVDMYFGKRESELEQVQGRYDELAERIYGIIEGVIPKPCGKRAVAAMEEGMRCAAKLLGDILLPRVLINEEFEAAIRAADKAEPAEAFAEPRAEENPLNHEEQSEVAQSAGDEAHEEDTDKAPQEGAPDGESGKPDPDAQTPSN